MIPPQTVQAILEAARIEEVVQEFLTLRRRGSGWVGLCPFHHEKTPSFHVNPARNIFKCFGCGKGGDAVSFLMEHERLTYPEALRWLAQKYRIDIQEVELSPDVRAEQQRAESLFIVNDFAARHFQEQLFHTDEGKSVALSYFHQRGLTEETLRTFGLGYAPDKSDLLLRQARQAGHDVALLQKVGLVSSDGTRDFFRARVIFPIHTLSGKIAAFAGRTLSTAKNIPKYINSPETEIYAKSRTLYGMFQAKRAIRQKNECLLVEGYLDVISLHQAGLQHVVASSGTALTEEQLQLIRRNAENLIILYDGDAAGVRAALRGLDLALAQGLQVRVVLLPEGEDPDSYVQRFGAAALEQYIAENARDVVLLKMRLLFDEAQRDPVRRAEVLKDIVASIALIPDPIRRSEYTRECAAAAAIDERALLEEVNKRVAADFRRKRQLAAAKADTNSDSADQAPPPGAPEAEEMPPAPALRPLTDEFQERDIVRLLIQFGNCPLPGEAITVAEWVLGDIEDALDEFDIPLYGRIVRECHQLLLRGQAVEPFFFLHHPSAEVAQLALEMLSQPWEYSPNWEKMWHFPLQNQPMPEENVEADVQQALAMFKIKKLNRLLEKNTQRLRAAQEKGDVREEVKCLQAHVKIEQARNRLSARFGIALFSKR